MPKKPQPSSRRIEDLDGNFKTQAGAAGLTWIDAFDSRLAIRGLGWLKEAHEARSLRRLPDRAAPLLSQGVQELSRCPSSVFLSFFTDSPALSVRLVNADAEIMPHMPSTGSGGAELYLREGIQWLPVATAIPAPGECRFERTLLEGMPRRRREYRLYLPLYKATQQVALGFPSGAKVEPAPAPKGTRPIFFYGTSITQGGCANTAGSDFVSIVGRMLDAETINFGFSGNGKGEPEIAALIAEVDAEIFVLDYAANSGEPEQLAATLPKFVRVLREKRPQTPIVLLGNITFNQVLWDAARRDTLVRRRDEILRFYLRAREQGDDQIHFIDGDGLLPAGLTGAYVDGVHPTSVGFAVMAERLVPHLNVIRIWNRESCPEKRR